MYTHYAIIENAQVVQYPVDPHRRENGDLIPHALWVGGEFEGKTYAYCHDLDRPPYNQITQDLQEVTPVFDPVRGGWYRSYIVVPASEAVLTKRRGEKIVEIVNTMQNTVSYVDEVLMNSTLTDADRSEWVTYKERWLAVTTDPAFPWIDPLPPAPAIAFSAPTPIHEL